MSSQPTLDRRIERTRRSLRDAVLKLAETEDLDDISVHDITRKAGINRATFYQHYRDKHELIAQTVDFLLQQLFDGCAPVLSGEEHLESDRVHSSVIQIFEEVARRAPLYRRLIGHGGSAYFIDRFQARNVELSLKAFSHMDEPPGADQAPDNARAYFGAWATLGMLSYWLDHDLAESPEAMAAWYWRLIRPVFFDEIGDLGAIKPGTR